MAIEIKTIIFDLGGVLMDWNPLYVYDNHYFESQEKRDYFFSQICTGNWNEEQDAGKPISDATQEWWLNFQHGSRLSAISTAAGQICCAAVFRKR